jgi:Polyketide cyclase / dehydrase and lipid transport
VLRWERVSRAPIATDFVAGRPTATVVACEPARAFEIGVSAGPLSVANWRYEFEETGSGCRVTESWADRRGTFTALIGRVLGDHGADHARREMAATLANLAAVVEVGAK